jgi:hypothetical protein
MAPVSCRPSDANASKTKAARESLLSSGDEACVAEISPPVLLDTDEPSVTFGLQQHAWELRPGRSRRSLAFEVAALEGIPRGVVSLAEQLLGETQAHLNPHRNASAHAENSRVGINVAQERSLEVAILEFKHSVQLSVQSTFENVSPTSTGEIGPGTIDVCVLNGIHDSPAPATSGKSIDFHTYMSEYVP